MGRHLVQAFKEAFGNRFLRRLLLESVGFEGLFRAGKDYLQPVLQAAAIPLVAILALEGELGEPQQVATLVGPIYFCLYLLSAVASRNAHKLAGRVGGERRGARLVWSLYLLTFAAMLPAMIFNIHWVIICGFVALFPLQNLFRPILISRIDNHCSEQQGATILSIENQCKSLSTMFLAPLLGLAVDLVERGGLGGKFWPIGAAGVAIALLFTLWPPPRRQGAQTC